MILACLCEKLLCSCLTYYLVCEAKRRWGGRLLVVYVEVLQVKRDVQIQFSWFSGRLGLKDHCAKAGKFILLGIRKVFPLSVVMCVLQGPESTVPFESSILHKILKSILLANNVEMQQWSKSKNTDSSFLYIQIANRALPEFWINVFHLLCIQRYSYLLLPS